MANIKKIQISGTSYDIVDATAARAEDLPTGELEVQFLNSDGTTASGALGSIVAGDNTYTVSSGGALYQHKVEIEFNNMYNSRFTCFFISSSATPITTSTISSLNGFVVNCLPIATYIQSGGEWPISVVFSSASLTVYFHYAYEAYVGSSGYDYSNCRVIDTDIVKEL